MMRIGTVGTGFVVDNFLDAAGRIPEISVTCVYSRDEARAQAFARRHGTGGHASDRAAFLNREDLDTVYVAAPNSLHFSWVRDALLAGKHVICEKPFVSTAREARELIRLAKERGLFLFEAITVPHLPNYRLVRDALSEVGPVRLAQLSFSQYSSRYGAFLAGENPNVFNPAFSGGCLMDLNYYNLWFLTGLFGEPKGIRYIPNKAENGIDTSGILILSYDGFLCEAAAAKDCPGACGAQIQGEKGYIRLEGASSLCRSLTLCEGDACRHLNDQNEMNVLYYELRDFVRIFEAKDYEMRDALLAGTLLAVQLTEKARRAAGLIFPADAAEDRDPEKGGEKKS